MDSWPVSLVIITFNEEANIKRCIESVPRASEVIVVDSLSTDKTCEIAQSLGAKVISQKFLGYRAQKQMAADLARGAWILSLDADEALSPALENEIGKLFSKPEAAGMTFETNDGYKIPRLSYHLGKWIKHGGWFPDYQKRLFKKEKAKWVGEEVHEHLVIQGRCGVLYNPLFHYVFKNLHHQIATNNKYSSQGARELFNKGRKPSILKLVFKPLGKFIETYIWKGGVLDGSAGLIISLGAAQSMFLKYAKLWELREFKPS